MLIQPASKQEWRTYLIQQRQKLTETERLAAAESLIKLLLQQDFWQGAKKIASYAAIKTELQLDNLHPIAWAQQKQLYLPVLDGERLAFCSYTDSTPMQANHYGILEPALISAPAISADELDLILLPAVGIDKHGVRLGMGKGYYDKTLQACKQVLLVGVIYECQLVEKLPQETTDIMMDIIITEQQLRSIK